MQERRSLPWSLFICLMLRKASCMFSSLAVNIPGDETELRQVYTVPVITSQECDIVTRQPAVFGRVTKEGVLPPERWFPSYKDSAIDKFARHLLQNHRSVNRPGGPPLPLRNGCHHLLLINDRYKLIYLKNTKVWVVPVGSRSIHILLSSHVG